MFFSIPIDVAQEREWERRLRALVAAGGKRSVAAKAIGMDPGTLQGWARDHRVPWAPYSGDPYALTAEMVDAEVARWKAGMEQRDLARANREADRVEAREGRRKRLSLRLAKARDAGTLLVDPAWLERQTGGR